MYVRPERSWKVEPSPAHSRAALAHLDDRLAVLEVAAVVVEGKVVDGVVLDLVPLLCESSFEEMMSSHFAIRR